MTPEEILKRAEQLGALTPQAVLNIFVVGVVAILLTVALAAYYRAKSGSKETESEATALSTAITSLTTTINRQHARDDKAEALIASMTQLSNETIAATNKTLTALLESVNTLVTSLGSFQAMGDNVAASQEKIDTLIGLLNAQQGLIESIYKTVQDMSTTQATKLAEVEARVVELELEKSQAKETPHA